MVSQQVKYFRSWGLLLGYIAIASQGFRYTHAEDLASDSFVRLFVERHCIDCHSEEDPAAGFNLDAIVENDLLEHTVPWEKVVRKLRARQMPPVDMERPPEREYLDALNSLELTLDRDAKENPRPGRTETFRRLTRAEYKNAIRDLLALDIDVEALLPKDESSHGFDNVTVGDLSPTLLNRYINAAQKISRLAIGSSQKSPDVHTIRIRPDVTQEEHVEGLPLGTRGGLLATYTFPQDGEYEIEVRLARDRDEHVEGLRGTHELEILVDLERVGLFAVKPPKRDEGVDDVYGQPSHDDVDKHLKSRISATAGPHQVGVTFLKQPSSLLETKRQPLNVHFNNDRHPRLTPAVFQVSIAGPFDPSGPGSTPSRQRIFECEPNAAEEEECAKQILSALMRRAYRRPVGEDDLKKPLKMYREARRQGDFEVGIESGLASILVNPHFLFRVERGPESLAANSVYQISDLDLASRLSFFLWKSIPDDELLDLAIDGQLSQPEVLERQVRRMLADERSNALVTEFAGQWLYLRNLESVSPDMRLYPDFDDNLRQALKRETELFFESVLREDRSVLDLLKSDYTFLNERLAKHYGIPNVYGSRFRKVSFDKGSKRGGLLRHGSILTVTSYATRTSPVIRGTWILENIIGTPPPPPPANVPALKDNTVAANLSVRERLAEHRANPACASCHDVMDPVGFALENYDALGRWRDREGGKPVDASGGLPDGSRFTGIDGLELGLLNRPELFVGTMCEKLLTYALGRGIEPYDAPAIRQIVRDAEPEDFRFSSLVLGIVNSTPFQMRTSQ